MRGTDRWLTVGVAMQATVDRITAERYYAPTVEGDRRQLVDGRVVLNDPRAIHALLQLRVAAALHAWTQAGEGRGLALLPTDIRMDDFNVFAPDVLWFREERLQASLDAYPEHVPDLAVEIRSHSTWRYDLGAKKAVYEAGGLPELWLVDDRSKSVLVYRRATPGAPISDVGARARPGRAAQVPAHAGLRPRARSAVRALIRRSTSAGAGSGESRARSAAPRPASPPPARRRIAPVRGGARDRA